MTGQTEIAFRYSRYANALTRRDPALVERVLANPSERLDTETFRRILSSTDVSVIDARLRELRREAMLRTILRDVAYCASHQSLVQDLSQFATLCVAAATQTHLATLPSLAHDRIAFSVVGMGKLGGEELNVSSDIDIVFLCDSPESDELEAINRLATAVTRSLDRVVDGDFVFRVDTRLRPYGSAGPMVPTLDFLESYFVAQGRTWERLAWLRATTLVGALESPIAALVNPFVFRRYLDFDAIDGVRDLHRQLRAEKTDPNNVKLGRGGIRELEFGVQLRQILRGGRDRRLQAKNTLDALDALADAGHVERERAHAVAAHYRFLRRVEHFLQYRDDQQTQTLPRSDAELGALSEAFGASSLDEFLKTVSDTRNDVAAFFDETLGGVASPTPRRAMAVAAQEIESDSMHWRGYRDQPASEAYFKATLAGSRVQTLPTASRDRLMQLAERARHYAITTDSPDDALKRSLDLLVSVSGRSSYLALMKERPDALRRVVDLAAASEWATRYLMAHPLLLDELIDARSVTDEIDYSNWHRELTRAIAASQGDVERGMDALRHFQQAELFRLLLRDLAGALSVETLSDHLSALADVCVDCVLSHQLHVAGLPADAPIAVIAYGKWGSKELGYASDLDLIFLIDDAAISQRELLTRVAQRLQNWLTTLTAAGRAYEIDVRLRPDGISGLLLTTRAAFIEYQREKAWTWEHQALTRARFAAGHRALGAAFESIRETILAMPRDWPKLRDEVLDMRARIAKEHPNRDRDTHFDLKHDPGGIVDLEFAVQTLVLRFSASHLELRRDLGNIALVRIAAQLGLLGANGDAIAKAAADAYRELRKRHHGLRLRGVDKARIPRDEAAKFEQPIHALWQTVFER